MAPRTYLVRGAGSGPGGLVTGDDVNDMLQRDFDRLFDNARFRLTVTSGAQTDDIAGNILTNETATPLDDKFLEQGWQDGMGVKFPWPQTNTGPVTLAVNGGSALNVVRFDGTAMPAGALPTGLWVELTYTAGRFVCVSQTVTNQVLDPRYFFVLSSSGTWNKPTLTDNVAWNIGLWGAGASGRSVSSSNRGGGGGGGYVQGLIRHADMPNSVAVVIGAGGSPGTGPTKVAGGSTNFGSFFSAPGAPGGGGETVEGADVFSTGIWSGGAAADLSGSSAAADSMWGGAGGGVSGAGLSRPPGVSQMGGNGGANNQDGQPRGGGGGHLANGGRGECWIWN